MVTGVASQSYVRYPRPKPGKELCDGEGRQLGYGQVVSAMSTSDANRRSQDALLDTVKRKACHDAVMVWWS